MSLPGKSMKIGGWNYHVSDQGAINNQYLATPPPNAESYSGMALDPTTGDVYASSTSVASSSICAFDVLSGAATSCDPISGSAGHVALSFDSAGNAFGLDIVSDSFMQIDPDSGATSNVVPLPFDANFGQGMMYDPATGLIHMLAFNNGTFLAELWTVDTSNPVAPVFAFAGNLGSAVPGGLNQLSWGGTDLGGGGNPCAPNDIPWLSATPTNGTTAPGGSDTVQVDFDSTGLSSGIYTGTLCIESNDPVDPQVRVPVTLTVNEIPPAPALVLTKTVGLDNATCAATDNLSVDSGTDVYYCYTVQNTGNVTFTIHDLFDDKLGPLFTTLVQDLGPGQTFSYYPVTATITGSVTNVATWTAYVDTSLFVTATDSATVTGNPTAVSLSSFGGDSNIIMLPLLVGLLAFLVLGVGFFIRRLQPEAEQE